MSLRGVDDKTSTFLIFLARGGRKWIRLRLGLLLVDHFRLLLL